MQKPLVEPRRSTLLLLGLLLFGLALRALYFWLCARHLPMSGDEHHYFLRSADLVALISSFGKAETSAVAEAADRIIGPACPSFCFRSGCSPTT